jgi:hypothetical protein
VPSSEPDGLDYASLFAAGQTFAQNLSSDNWTDYNQHDPGVTILQQLCYALTDLVYRAGYDDADLLIPQRGEKGDKEKTTFFLGPEILTCAPVTQHDYRTLLYGQIENVDNSWLRPADDPRNIRGLYEIDVQPYDIGVSESYVLDLKRQVRSTYLLKRPLCEDFAGINVLNPLMVTIAAEIEIDDSQPANDIAANIIFDLQQNLVPAPSYASIELERQEGLSYDKIYEGPAMDVLVENQTPDKRPMHLPVDRFLKIARGADGVRVIRKLSVEASGQPDTATSGLTWSKNEFPTIDVQRTFPKGKGTNPNFVLKLGSVPQPLDGDRIANNIDHHKYMYHEDVISKTRSVRTDPYNALPIGVDRSPGIYSSIREQFPQTYGLGQYGATNAFFISGSQNSDYRNIRAIEVSRLKAYLLIFEQVMADHLAQLENLPKLFSLDESSASSTYFYQPIQGSEIAGPLSIQDVLPPGPAAAVAALVKGGDRALDRRERLLNHLLARFNEKFDDARWARVREATCTTASDLDGMIASRNKAKTDFLADYVYIGGSRGAGIDYSQPVSGDISGSSPAGRSGDDDAGGPEDADAPAGLERRVKLLTGISELYIVEHILLRNRADTQDGALAHFYSLKLSVIVPSVFIQREPAMQTFIERTVGDNCPAHIENRCLFLETAPMEQFKTSYRSWRSAYANAFARAEEASDTVLVDLDGQSTKLREFLMDSWDEQPN